MRLVFATPYYLPEKKFGGPPQKIHSIAAGLVAAGHSVTVFTFRSEQRSSREAWSLAGVSVQTLRWLGYKQKQIPLDRERLRTAIAEADVLQAFGIYNFLSPIAARFAVQSQTPFVLEPLGMYPPRAANQIAKKTYNRFITAEMVRHAAAVLAASNAEAGDLAQIADPEKIVFRRNGIDLADFAKLPSGDAMREKWGVVPEEQLILYIGRISPIKNLEDLVLAFGSAAPLKTRLVLVGPLSESWYEKKLRELVRRSGLDNQVTLNGPLYEEEHKAALAAADFLVLPSLNESFGNAAAEAVAADVPVLLTETCGIAPVIHKRAGYAVPLGVESIGDGLKRMLNPAFRDQMTSRRQEVKRELSWEQPVADTITLYESIIARSRKSKRAA